jgi:hypothetical protein
MSSYRPEVGQVAQQLGKVQFRLTGLEAATYRGLDSALRLGIANTLAKGIRVTRRRVESRTGVGCN